jgi:hypothetical protein
LKTTPDDQEFVSAVDKQIENNSMHERVVFMDHDNEVREVIYAKEFKNNHLQRERERLEKEGVLKGVVHIAATVLGKRDGHGPRLSTVEYVPNGQRYVRQHTISPALWMENQDLVDNALEATDAVFRGEEGNRGAIKY